MQLKPVLSFGAIALALWASAMKARANPFVLFRGTPNGELPAIQGALLFGALDASGYPTLTSEIGLPGGVTVDTEADGSVYAGYFNYNPLAETFIHPEFPVLDRQLGFAIEFQVSLDRSSNHRSDRSGLSLTVITDDTQGIELGLELDTIFAQSAIFNRAEEVAIDTQVMRTYQLRVQGDRYQLFTTNELILSGKLRRYLFNPRSNRPPLLFDPYTTPGFLFLGDNTSSESATFTLHAFSIQDIPTQTLR